MNPAFWINSVDNQLIANLGSSANTPKFLAMKADSFLLYLAEDGLDNVVTARQQHRESDKPSRELYQRCAKTMVQVGASITDNTFAKNTGMMLEIIPTQNPTVSIPDKWPSFAFSLRINRCRVFWYVTGTGMRPIA